MPGLLSKGERPPFIDPDWDRRDDPVPAWIIAMHVVFMVWTIFNAHHPELFVPGLLFLASSIVCLKMAASTSRESAARAQEQ